MPTLYRAYIWPMPSVCYIYVYIFIVGYYRLIKFIVYGSIFSIYIVYPWYMCRVMVLPPVRFDWTLLFLPPAKIFLPPVTYNLPLSNAADAATTIVNHAFDGISNSLEKALSSNTALTLSCTL
jgi:hypothetical protein